MSVVGETASDVGYNDITPNFQRIHNDKCKCKKNLNDFLSHVPSHDIGHHLQSQDQQMKTAAQNLLLCDSANNHNNCKSDMNNATQIKTHFLTLALRFHPDKNDQTLIDKCNTIMQVLNDSYIILISNATHLTPNKNVAYKNGHRYTKVSSDTVTCEFVSEFSVYSNKALEKLWLHELASHFPYKPTKLKNNRGSLFGNTKQSLHISVFHNGTVLCQGVMALTFGIDIVQTTILPIILKRTIDENIKLNSSSRSDKLKTALKLFEQISTIESHQTGFTKPTAESASAMPIHGITSSQLISEEKQLSMSVSPIPSQRQTNSKLASPNQKILVHGETNSSQIPSSKTTLFSTPPTPMTNSEQIEERIVNRMSIPATTPGPTGPPVCESCSTELKVLTEKLKQATEHITSLEKLVSQILDSQKHAETTIGPRLSNLLSRVIDLEQGSSTTPAKQVIERESVSLNNQQNNSYRPTVFDSQAVSQLQNEQDKIQSQDPHPWLTVTRKQKPKTVTKHDVNKKDNQAQPNRNTKSVEFSPEKCILIHGMEKLVKHDKFIRQAIAKSYQPAIVEWIKNYSEFEPKYLVQLAKSEMVTKVIDNWQKDNLGSSKVRGLSSDKPGLSQSNIGFAKHVDKDLSVSELDESINNTFPGAKCYRLHKGESTLNTVKIVFKNADDLRRATEVGVFLGHYSVRVDREHKTIRFIQCRNCWAYGHIKKFCPYDKRCSRCGITADHNNCELTQKCCNCNGPHTSRDWKACMTFQNYANYKKNKHSK